MANAEGLGGSIPATVAAVGTFLAVSAAAYLAWPPSPTEVTWGIVFVAWILFIVFWASKLVAARWNKYIARKFIHFTTGGLVAVLSPWIFETPTIPVIGAAGMALMTVLPRIWGSELDWYQVRDNFGDTWFCVSFALLYALLWWTDLRLAVIPAVFMAYGDGVTGVVRSVVYGRWIKGWWGTAAMALVCLPVGLLAAGVPGLLAGAAATAVEKLSLLDDNITVPAVSAAVLYLLM